MILAEVQTALSISVNNKDIKKISKVMESFVHALFMNFYKKSL
jgi:hypothetical protein